MKSPLFGILVILIFSFELYRLSLFLDPPLSQEKENILPTSQTAPDETQKRTGLNPIEPKEVENKRRIVEPDRTQSADEVKSRACAAFSCSSEDYLFISDNVS